MAKLSSASRRVLNLENLSLMPLDTPFRNLRTIPKFSLFSLTAMISSNR